MSTRRNVIATTIAGAAWLSSNSRLLAAAPDMQEKGDDVKDQAEDPRITRARLAGPEQVTRNATVAR
jgi:hypothetical protein